MHRSAILLLLITLSCSSPSKRIRVQFEHVAYKKYKNVEVIKIDGEVIKLDSCVIKSDSLFGKWGDNMIKMPIGEIRKVEKVKKYSTTEKAIARIFISTVSIVIILLFVLKPGV